MDRTIVDVEGFPDNADEAASRLRSLALRLNRELNDTVVFLRFAHPVLLVSGNAVETNATKFPKQFQVPTSKGEIGSVKRTPKQLAELVVKFANSDLLENMLLSSVSRFESTLADMLRILLRMNREGLLLGTGDRKQIDIVSVLKADSLQTLVSQQIEGRVRLTIRLSPKEYLSYLEQISSVKIRKSASDVFCEVKATRDLIVHADGIVNESYKGKAGSLARAQDGERISVDQPYLTSAIVAMKAIVVDISQGYEKKFGSEL